MYPIDINDIKEKKICNINSNNVLFLMTIAHSEYQVLKHHDTDTPQYFGVSTLTKDYNNGYKNRLFMLPDNMTYVSTASTPGLWGMLSEYDDALDSIDNKFLPNIGKTIPFIGNTEDSFIEYHKYKSKLRYTKQKNVRIQDLYDCIWSSYESKQGIEVQTFDSNGTRIDRKLNNLSCLYCEEKSKIIEKHFYFSGACLSFNGLGMLSQGVNAPENKQLINQGRFGLYGIDKFYMTNVLMACNYMRGRGIIESKTIKYKLSQSLIDSCKYIIKNKKIYYDAVNKINYNEKKILNSIIEKIIRISYKLLSNFDNINIWLDSFDSIYLSEIIYTILIDSSAQNFQQRIVIINPSCSTLVINEIYKTNQITRKYPYGERISVYTCDSIRTNYNVYNTYCSVFDYIERYNLISSAKFWINNLKKKIIYLEKKGDKKTYDSLLNLYYVIQNNIDYNLLDLNKLSYIIRNHVVPKNNKNTKSFVSYWNTFIRNDYNTLNMCYHNSTWLLCNPSTQRYTKINKSDNYLDNEWHLVSRKNNLKISI